MEISYRREIKHNYLVITPDSGTTPGYEARMLAGNEIQGLLRMHIRYQDGSSLYYYDITSRQPLSRLLDARFISRDEICQILIQIHVALMRMEEYLLGDGGILLDPGLIYMDPELFQIGLCLVPGQTGVFPEQLSRFLQYILKCVNHKDRECVVLAYGVYQESLKENYSLDDILKFIVSDNDKRELAKEKEQHVSGSGHKDRYEYQAEGEPVPDRKYVKRWNGEEEGGMPGRDIHKDGVQKNGVKKELVSMAKLAAVWIGAVVLVPMAIWLFGGTGRLASMKATLVWLDLGLFLFLTAANILRILLYKINGKHEAATDGGLESGQEPEQDPWRILYDDKEETWPLETDKNAMEPAPRNAQEAKSSPEPLEDEVFRTALLCGEPSGEGVRRLRALDEGGEDIILPYYPFVIGKNKNLADYTLQKDTVSRFHLRIDNEGENYTVTDLNSTNGTRVNGKALDANETSLIKAGDEIYIADVGYVFE